MTDGVFACFVVCLKVELPEHITYKFKP